jgi:hypothetical protein
MSITFSIPNSPTTLTEESCMCAQMAPRFCAQFEGEFTLDEIRDELREHASDECWSCKGTGVVSWEVPDADCEVNLSNVNAMAMLALMGVEADYCGTITSEDIPSVVRRLMRAVNSEGTRGAFTVEAQEIPASPGRLVPVQDGNVVRLERQGGSCHVFVGGRDDEYVARTAGRLLALCRKAQEAGEEVTWG